MISALCKTMRNQCLTKSVLHLLIANCLFLQILESEGLQDVRLESYKYHRLGQDINLRCSYDLEGGTLYAVKWYRGNDEFYRFIPKMLRAKQIFPSSGLSIDYFNSDNHHAILKNASFETSGIFRCSVSVEGSFQTISDSKNVSVVSIGYDAPSLILKDLFYEPGTRGEASCRIDQTFPTANVTWLINGKEITEKVITRVEEDETDPRLFNTISVMYFELPRNNYRSVVIKCRVELYDIYSETSMFTIHPRNLNSRKVEVPNSLHSSALQTLRLGDSKEITIFSCIAVCAQLLFLIKI